MCAARLLRGNKNRREGGQGVVVFATSKFNSDVWAIKFFVYQRHFEEERAMYQDRTLGKVLPKVRSEIVLKSSTRIWPVNRTCVGARVSVSKTKQTVFWMLSSRIFEFRS